MRRENTATKTRKHEEDRFGFVLSCLRGQLMLVAALLSAAPALAATKAIRAGKVIDPAGTVITNAVIVIDDDRITSIGTGAPPAGAEVIDLSRFTLIPGLIDLHTHMTYFWDGTPGTRPLNQPRRPAGVTTVLAAVVAFGALCTAAGYSLGVAPRPFSVATERSRPGAEQVLAAVLAMPAGWMIFALLVPVAGVGAKAGWAVATDGLAERRERILGGCLVAACVAGSVASAVVLAKVL